MEFPHTIAARLGSAVYQENFTGKSDASVLMFDDYVLKIRPVDSPDTIDVEIMQWLAGKLPVPEIAAHEVEDGKDWLLMTRNRGRMLCDASVMEKPILLLDCMAEALHLLWSVPIAGCPFTQRVEEILERAEQRIARGTFDTSDCEPETFGPGGFETPEALLEFLKKRQPAVKRTLTHGDFCLPNLFTDGKHFSGFIDLGNAGICDPWMDLALGWRSLKHNSDGHYGKTYPWIDPDDLFRAAGVERDAEKLRYYLLLDELT